MRVTKEEHLGSVVTVLSHSKNKRNTFSGIVPCGSKFEIGPFPDDFFLGDGEICCLG